MTRSIYAAALLVLLAAPAMGQGTNPAAIQAPGFAPGSAAAGRGPATRPAPPALPGSRAEPAGIIPAERNAADLPPTEALFDSINRGDLPAARDAIARGADLQGLNVLGLTPLELSVDLGRNDISFLLLSLRSGAGYGAARGTPPTAQPATPTRAERVAADRAQRTQAAARPAAGAAPQAPRLFAGNGGAPIPQAGFLGFDAGR